MPDVLIVGPVREGEKMASGKLYPASGWCWCCADCKRSAFGFATEDDADFDALAHPCEPPDTARYASPPAPPVDPEAPTGPAR